MPSSPHSLSLYFSCIWVPFNPIFPFFRAFNPPLSSLLFYVGFPFLVWRCGLIIEYFWMDLDLTDDLFSFTYHLICCIGYFRGGDRGVLLFPSRAQCRPVLILSTPSQAIFASLGILSTPVSLFQGEVFGSAIHLN